MEGRGGGGGGGGGGRGGGGLRMKDEVILGPLSVLLKGFTTSPKSRGTCGNSQLCAAVQVGGDTTVGDAARFELVSSSCLTLLFVRDSCWVCQSKVMAVSSRICLSVYRSLR